MLQSIQIHKHKKQQHPTQHQHPQPNLPELKKSTQLDECESNDTSNITTHSHP